VIVTRETTVGYLAVLRNNRSYRLLWMGEVVSLLGDWFSLIASATLVAQLTGSGMAVGGLFLMRMLPPFLVSPIAGVLADRYDRKALLVVSDLVRMVTVLGFLLVREPHQVWLLYALTAMQLAFTGVFFPTRNALLPSLVSGRELGTANALSSVTWSTMLAVGAAAGGLIAGHFGVATAFVVDSVTYLVSALLLLAIRVPQGDSPEDQTGVGAAVREYVDGLRYLGGHREILFTALHKALFALTVGGVWQVIIVTVSREVFVIGEGGSTGLGLMYAVAGIGTGIGPILVRRLIGDDRRRLRRAIVGAYAMVVVGMAVSAPLVSFGLLLFGILLRAIGGGINWVFSTQLLMMALPGGVRGRVFGTEFAVFTLAEAISVAIGGWALDHSGLSLSSLIAVVAAIPLIPGVTWAWWLRRLEGREALPASSQ